MSWGIGTCKGCGEVIWVDFSGCDCKTRSEQECRDCINIGPCIIVKKEKVCVDYVEKTGDNEYIPIF